MARRPLRWQLYPSYLLIIVMAVVALAWWAIEAQDAFYYEQTELDLRARAQLVEEQVRSLIAADDIEAVADLARVFGERTSTRITVILPDGRVVGDTDEDPEAMDHHSARPEVVQALNEAYGMSIRRSSTLQKKMMYVAIRVVSEGRAIGMVRTAMPITFIDEAKEALRFKMIAGGLAVAMLAAAVSLIVSHRITRPLEHLRRGAQRFARGDLIGRLAVPPSEEIGELAEAMNEMAAQLHLRIGTISKQRREQEAVLSSMVEGVMAVDPDERIINLNRAAAELMAVDREGVIGLTVPEAVRNSGLQQVIDQTLRKRRTVQEEVIFSRGQKERLVQVSSSVLRDAEGQRIGAVVVLNDVTRLRKLENMRREFVANVSHELKTPITSIKGSVETLLDGAIENRDDAMRFLQMIARQGDRLHHIVEDLLSLSRIERESEREEISLQTRAVGDVLRAAVASCEAKSREIGVDVTLECPDDLTASLNAHLLEQGVINLIDNALKYSEAETTVTVRARQDAGEIAIEVSDEGCGIESKHLDRLFERFYRVDKARSRRMGGTGLGLAIVKHIAIAHGGSVSVRSTVGRGSSFTIHLPGQSSAGPSPAKPPDEIRTG